MELVKAPNRAFVASLFIHFIVAIFLLWMETHPVVPVSRDKELTWIEIEPAIPAPPKDESTRKEIVQTLPGEKAEVAAKDAFLGERTQVVDRQTVSKNKTTVIAKAQDKGASAPQKTAEKPASERSRASSSAPLAKFGVPMLPFQQTNSRNELMQAERDNMRWANQGEQLQEYVKGFQEGEQTLLNTREFVFYGYFSRIREKLDRAWVPILRERVSMWYRGGRRIAAETEHVTRVLVILNRDGEITQVKMLSESGTKILDEAAVRAFNEAGPFPNPPRGLVNEKSEIEVPWEFVLRT